MAFLQPSNSDHCRYGLSSLYSNRLTAGLLHASGRDRAGEVRAVELRGHPFFVATLFQPERSALAGRRHPLVSAFTDAVRERAAAQHGMQSTARLDGERRG